MCGIVGEFVTTQRLITEALFKKLNQLNYYRGPDMDGYWTNGTTCQLGFRRLSILDLSIEGNQPICSNSGRYAMTFNGEIYNYQTLKTDLLSHGIQFKSTSDSEVLVNAFQVYGIEQTLDKIDGMFAIGLFDNETKQLHLIRDFAGIKPLFYGVKNGNVVFGSRYDQITSHPNFSQNGVNEAVLHTYMKSHYLPAPYGILNNTYQVEPGQHITITSAGQLLKRYYWRLPKHQPHDTFQNASEAKHQLIDALNTAVKDEMVSDVPVGTFLSGGIDSPLITYFANNHQPGIKSYTIGSDSKILDETAQAKQYAELIGTQHFIEQMASKDAADILEKCMSHLQEPFADFSLIPTYVVSQIAKNNGSTVVLSGDGADELFYGYKRYESIIKNRPFNRIPKSMRYAAYGLDKVLFKNKHINSHFLKPTHAEAHRSMHSRINDADLKKIFNADLVNKLELPAYTYNNASSETDILLNMQYGEYYDMMQKTLTKVDRMSMAHSIEVRVPFLKKSFIEAAVQIHPKLSYHNGGTKLLLKDVLRTVVPKAPIDAVKKGFGVPIEKWMREQLREPIGDAIFATNFLQSFDLSAQTLDKFWQEHQSGVKDRKWILFTLYSLAKWQEHLKR
ncbi:MAG: asparagine synthase (glutamine-hydrolyzing) [Flavobacteriaceae bacterium]